MSRKLPLPLYRPQDPPLETAGLGKLGHVESGVDLHQQLHERSGDRSSGHPVFDGRDHERYQLEVLLGHGLVPVLFQVAVVFLGLGALRVLPAVSAP